MDQHALIEAADALIGGRVELDDQRVDVGLRSFGFSITSMPPTDLSCGAPVSAGRSALLAIDSELIAVSASRPVRSVKPSRPGAPASLLTQSPSINESTDPRLCRPCARPRR